MFGHQRIQDQTADGTVREWSNPSKMESREFRSQQTVTCLKTFVRIRKNCSWKKLLWCIKCCVMDTQVQGCYNNPYLLYISDGFLIFFIVYLLNADVTDVLKYQITFHISVEYCTRLFSLRECLFFQSKYCAQRVHSII